MKLNKDKNTIAVLLLVIVCVGLVLRAIGIQFGKPFRYHPDEIKLVLQAAHLMNYKGWSQETLLRIGYYPPFFTYILTVVFSVYALFATLVGSIHNLSAVKEIYYTNTFQFHYIARLLSLFIGTITIPLLYFLGKKLYSRVAGLIAAAFLAVAFLHVRNSHFGVVDIFLTFLARSKRLQV